MAELNTTAVDGSPSTDASSTLMIFNSDRPGGLGLRDLWSTTRTSPSDPWGTPTLVPELSTTAGTEATPALRADGLVIYFSQGSGLDDRDLYVARRTSTAEPFGAPEHIVELATPSDEADPWVSPDDRTLYFVSPISGQHEIYVSRR
jgi:hypothetical protein